MINFKFLLVHCGSLWVFVLQKNQEERYHTQSLGALNIVLLNLDDLAIELFSNFQYSILNFSIFTGKYTIEVDTFTPYLASMVVTDLTIIAQEGITKEEENLRFEEIVRNKNSNAVDELVFQLNESISSQIDCTQCGNCCRSLMINVTPEDSQRLAAHLHTSTEEFEEKYIEHSGEGTLAVINSIPCHFLHENKCTVYTARPKECREFPALHRKGFTGRLFAIFMHYGRCPIVYNVIEALKTNIGACQSK